MNQVQRKKRFNKESHQRGLFWPTGYGGTWRLYNGLSYRPLVCVACEGTGVDSEVADFFDYGLGAGDSCPACHGNSVTKKQYYFQWWMNRRQRRTIFTCSMYMEGQPSKRRFHSAHRLALGHIRH